MRIRAPFELHKVAIDTSTGQASGERWYLAPFTLWRRRVLGVQVHTKTSFDYARDPKIAQYLGSMSFYAGRETWRIG